MNKITQEMFEKINEEVQDLIKNNNKEVSLDKIIEMYKPIITNDYFDKDENMELRDKINLIVNQLANLIYNHALYDERKDKHSYNSHYYWYATITLTLLFIIFSSLSLTVISVLLIILTGFSFGKGFISSILASVYTHKYEKTGMQLQYVSKLLYGATLELKRLESDDIEDIKELSETLVDNNQKIKYTFNDEELNINVYENENNEVVGSYKLTRHK